MAGIPTSWPGRTVSASMPPTPLMEIIDHESSGIAVPGVIWLAVSIFGPLLPWSDYAVFAVAVVIGYWPAVALWASFMTRPTR